MISPREWEELGLDRDTYDHYEAISLSDFTISFDVDTIGWLSSYVFVVARKSGHKSRVEIVGNYFRRSKAEQVAMTLRLST